MLQTLWSLSLCVSVGVQDLQANPVVTLSVCQCTSPGLARKPCGHSLCVSMCTSPVLAGKPCGHSLCVSVYESRTCTQTLWSLSLCVNVHESSTCRQSRTCTQTLWSLSLCVSVRVQDLHANPVVTLSVCQCATCRQHMYHKKALFLNPVVIPCVLACQDLCAPGCMLSYWH